VTYVITDACIDVNDRTCVTQCPMDCIYEGKRMLYIHPDECIDCGACEPLCPVDAVYFEPDLPEERTRFVAVATEHLQETGAFGGASLLGPLGVDHPVVAAWPAQSPQG